MSKEEAAFWQEERNKAALAEIEAREEAEAWEARYHSAVAEAERLRAVIEAHKRQSINIAGLECRAVTVADRTLWSVLDD